MQRRIDWKALEPTVRACIAECCQDGGSLTPRLLQAALCKAGVHTRKKQVKRKLAVLALRRRPSPQQVEAGEAQRQPPAPPPTAQQWTKAALAAAATQPQCATVQYDAIVMATPLEAADPDISPAMPLAAAWPLLSTPPARKSRAGRREKIAALPTRASLVAGTSGKLARP